jgi:cell division protein FtsI/penicillin-binding protein 2
MKPKEFQIIVILCLSLILLLSSCNPATVSTLSPTITTDPLLETKTILPDPVVRTTQIPRAQATAIAYLDAWKTDDTEKMYSLLSTESQKVLTQEAFQQKYESIANETALKEVRYEILSDENTNENTSRVNYRVTLASNLVGDITRETGMKLNFEQGEWRVQYDDALILPELAGGNQLRMDLNPATRASIYDRNGNLLAGQAEATSIGLIPDYIDPENADGLFGLLSRASGLTTSEIRSRVENASPGEYLALGQVSSQESSNLLRALGAYGAVVLTNYVSRYYPQNGIAPHLIGYVQAIAKEELSKFRRLGYRTDEKVGRKGIERWGEDALVGQHGGVLYLVDPQGTPIGELGSAVSKPGETIYATIDSEFQSGVQEALRGFNGAAVVLEKDTGRVLAFASSPGFDPNSFQTENYNWWTTLPGVVNDPNLPEFDRATQGLYPLGSVFKVITAAAALESGLYTADTTYDCQYDFTEVAGLVLHDWTYTHFLEDGETPPSGLLTLPEGLIRSCDPFFWHLGKGLYDAGKKTAVSDMARGFGLGSLTNIGVVDENAGTVPDPQSEVDAVNLAIGQGNLQVTPLQVANFMAAIGNGGSLYRPQAIEKIVAEDGTTTYEFKPELKSLLPIKPENLKVIQDAMRAVTNSNKPRGTAYLVFNGFRIPVFGKTGTAQTQTEKPHAWFAGYTGLGGSEKPDIAIAVVAESAGEGSEITAPIFRRIVELYFTGAPGRLYPWEASIGVTKTPTSIYTETPTPEVIENP